MVGLSMVAVFAIAAVTATSASALPEWGKCVAQPGGKYTDSNCTTKGKGGTFEWVKGINLAPRGFTGENVGSGGVLTSNYGECRKGTFSEKPAITRKKCEEGGGEIVYEGAIQVECASQHNKGASAGKNTVKDVTVTFLGCNVFGGIPCSNGPAPGEIVVNQLKGSLGYISKSEKKVGLLLEPAKKHGEFAKFNCGGVDSIIVGVGNTKEGAFYTPENHGGYDGIISPMTPVNTMTHTFEQQYTVNPETFENIPNKFEGKHIELLESYAIFLAQPNVGSLWSAADEEITNKSYVCATENAPPEGCNGGPEEVEIKA